MTLYIGLMSGTSMDGIDVALVQLPENKLVHGLTRQYSNLVKSQLINLMHEQKSKLAELCQLHTLIGREFAYAVHDILRVSGYSAADIKAIGSHGQTVCHDATTPIPYTLQLGCGHTISSLTGIEVVADFRTRDLVHGGHGAPFAPLYHLELFRQEQEAVAIVNVGGIANVTLLEPNKGAKGWDVGPGNCLMDAWIYHHLHQPYDVDGAWAAEGCVIEPLLKNLLSDPFFRQLPPKSIGKEYFSLAWLTSYGSDVYKAEDVQATLVALTASCIAQNILLNPVPETSNQSALISEQPHPKKIYLCGGGTHNKQLVQMLTNYLSQKTIHSVADLSVDPDYLEAMMFAWLASQTLQHIPMDLRGITGSKSTSILGAIYPVKKQ
jgi:anhydro-N-acetylmuramic acid kinase